MEHRSLAPNLIVSDGVISCGDQLAGESETNVAHKELFKKQQMGRAVNCSDLELSTYLQALAEGYLPTFYSDTSQSAQSKLMSIANKSFLRGKKTVVFHGFQSLKMSRPLTESRGAELLTLFVEASRAKTFQPQEKAQELTESAAECGHTWPASLAKFDPDTSSWKTAQHSLLGGLDEFSETWPRWGLMRSGECWERQTLVPRTSENESGCLPKAWTTPSASDATRGGTITEAMTGTSLVQQVNTPAKLPTPTASDHTGPGHSAQGGMNLRTAVSLWPTPTVCGNYNRKGASKTSGDGLATAVAMSSTTSCLESTDAPTAKARTWPTATATAYKGWSQNHKRAGTDDRLDYSVEREAFQPGQQTPPMRLNPDWVELLMGWPMGWTSLEPMNKEEFDAWHFGFSAESVQNMRERVQPEAVQWEAGRCNDLSAERALQQNMRQQPGGNNSRGIPVESTQAQKECVRGMRIQGEVGSPPLRPRPDEQQPGKLTDTLQPLPRLLARYGEKAWKDGSWEDAIPRVTTGMAHRSHRIKAIGNGQVSRVAAAAFTLLGGMT